MSQDVLITAALDFPWHLRAYDRWLSQRSAEFDDYLYTQQRVRLTPCDDDLLAVPEGLSIQQTGDVISLCAAGQAPFPIPRLARRDAEKLVSALLCKPAAIELPLASGVASDVCDRVLQLGFGRFIFAPEAVTRLELSCSSAEIVRFPGSPYEIVRNYWANVGTLTTAIERTLASSRAATSFVHWLRALHVQLLLGSDLNTFYCPSSPVASRRVEPGALFTTATKTLTTCHGEFIVEGPRVNASEVGGAQYNRILDRSLGIQPISSESRSFVSGKTTWGHLLTARARTETEDRLWYLPPRPFTDEHWEELFVTWNAAIETTDPSEATAHLGRFHWSFVHLHPFSCANQSLAFALVNWGLKRVVPSGIPHLILDQLALRHDCAEYVRIFVRAVRNWTTQGTEPVTRHMERVRKRQSLDEFIARLAAAKSDSDADAIAERNEHSARLALMSESPS